MDSSPNSMCFRRRNNLDGKRIATSEQLEVFDDEEYNGENQ